MTRRSAREGSSGFTLIEVMVALIIISIGLLGVAKMQALAVSNTTVARQRALAAIEAASLASAIRANRAYWAARSTNLTVTTSGDTVTTTDSGLAGAVTTVGTSAPNYCNSTRSPVCAPQTMAANDLKGWAKELKAILPNSSATISCITSSPPVYCTIAVRWTESVVALNSQGLDAAADASFRTPDYILYLQP